LITAQRSKGEILVYPRSRIPKSLKSKKTSDEETGVAHAAMAQKAQLQSESKDQTGADRADTGMIQKQTAIFSWKDVVYDIKIKGEPRRILDHVDGWVKPGTLTGLMV
jgi:ATP-binding cassette, subfamily G (WHITE), member 2, PDR